VPSCTPEQFQLTSATSASAMRLAGVVLGSLVISSLWQPVLSSLRSSASARRAARAKLRAEAARLAGALRGSFGEEFGAEASPEFAEAARVRLGAEAARLASAGQPGAALLRGYAVGAPPAVLLLPADALLPGAYGAPGSLAMAPDEEEEALPWPGALRGPRSFVMAPDEAEEADYAPPVRAGASASQETVFQSDGTGRSITRTKRCENGECMEQVEVHDAPQMDDRSRAAFAGGRDASEYGMGSRRAALQGSLSDAAQNMAGEMWKIQQSFGHSGLEDMMRDIFAASQNQFDGTEPRTPPANATDLKDGRKIESMSSSTEVVVKDGKVLKRAQLCKNGNCETNVTTGQVDHENSGHVGNSTGTSHKSANDKAVTMPL